MFHYLGNERLQFVFFTPNICAAFLIIAVLLTIGLFLLMIYQKNRYWQVASAILVVVIFLQLLMIGMTYSRGGYVACLGALVLGYVFSRKYWSLAFIFMFIFVLLIIGDGPARIKSIGDIGEGSIRNRLLLWRGSAGIIAENWTTGLDNSLSVGQYYTQWYQPLWLKENYLTLISDYLTIAATHGLIVLFGLLTAAGVLYQQGCKIWRINRDPLLLYSICGMAGYMICAVFSTCYYYAPLWLFAVTASVVLCYVIYGYIKHKPRWKHYDFWLSPAAAATVCLGILGFGTVVNAQIPYTVHRYKVLNAERSIRILELLSKKKSCATIIFLSSNVDGDIRPWLRPLTDMGYTVKAVETDYGSTGLENGKTVLSATTFQGETYLLGNESEKSLLAVALAANMPELPWSGIIVRNIPRNWPFEGFSPELLVHRIKAPLIMVQDSDTDASGDGKALLKICAENGIPATLEMIDSGDPAKIENWQFFRNHCTNEKNKTIL